MYISLYTINELDKNNILSDKVIGKYSPNFDRKAIRKGIMSLFRPRVI